MSKTVIATLPREQAHGFESVAQDRPYSSLLFTNIHSSLSLGGFSPTLGNQLKPTATGNDKTVRIETGGAFIAGHFFELDQPVDIQIPNAPTTQFRWDIIAIRINRTVGSREFEIIRIEGTPTGIDDTSGIPFRQLQNDELTLNSGIWEFPIAIVKQAGASNVNPDNIITALSSTNPLEPLKSFEDSLLGTTNQTVFRILVPNEKPINQNIETFLRVSIPRTISTKEVGLVINDFDSSETIIPLKDQNDNPIIANAASEKTIDLIFNQAEAKIFIANDGFIEAFPKTPKQVDLPSRWTQPALVIDGDANTGASVKGDRFDIKIGATTGTEGSGDSVFILDNGTQYNLLIDDNNRLLTSTDLDGTGTTIKKIAGTEIRIRVEVIDPIIGNTPKEYKYIELIKPPKQSVEDLSNLSTQGEVYDAVELNGFYLIKATSKIGMYKCVSKGSSAATFIGWLEGSSLTRFKTYIVQTTKNSTSSLIGTTLKIQTGTPTISEDAANKQYVDSKIPIIPTPPEQEEFVDISVGNTSGNVDWLNRRWKAADNKKRLWLEFSPSFSAVNDCYAELKINNASFNSPLQSNYFIFQEQPFAFSGTDSGIRTVIVEWLKGQTISQVTASQKLFRTTIITSAYDISRIKKVFIVEKPSETQKV